MDVSVIVVTRNTCALTRAAIRSVLEGGDHLAKEIIVVDNASSDETPRVLPAEFPTIKYLRSDNNLGFARANNRGARLAQGEFLALLNSDARLQSGALESAVAWMRANPTCAVVGGQLLNPDGSRQNSIANFATLATELLNKSLLRRLFPHRYPGKEQCFTAPIQVESVIGAFLLTRQTVWQAVGGLDERFFFFFEETDFCLQVHRRGLRIMHLPNVKVWHDQGQTVKQLSAAARIEYWRSRYAYFAKNHRQATRWLLVGGLWGRLLASWLLGLLATAITLGQKPSWREKWRVHHALCVWHLRGRPASVGLPR